MEEIFFYDVYCSLIQLILAGDLGPGGVLSMCLFWGRHVNAGPRDIIVELCYL